MARLFIVFLLGLALTGCANKAEVPELTTAKDKPVAELMEMAKSASSEEELRYFASHPNEGVRSDAAKNRSLPQDLQETLLKDQDWLVRSYLAANPEIQPKISEELAKDPDPRVRWVVAKNPVTPKDILKNFVTDSSPEVQKKLAGNTAIDEEIMVMIAVESNEAAVLELLKRKDLTEAVKVKVNERPEESIKKALSSL